MTFNTPLALSSNENAFKKFWRAIWGKRHLTQLSSLIINVERPTQSKGLNCYDKIYNLRWILGVKIVVIFKNSLKGNYNLIKHDLGTQAKKICWNMGTSPFFYTFEEKVA